MRQGVMRSKAQRQVGQRRRAAACPLHQVMPVAPVDRTGATGKDAVPVARLERAPRRRRQRPAGVIEFVVELVPTGDLAGGGVAGVTLHALVPPGPPPPSPPAPPPARP